MEHYIVTILLGINIALNCAVLYLVYKFLSSGQPHVDTGPHTFLKTSKQSARITDPVDNSDAALAEREERGTLGRTPR